MTDDKKDYRMVLLVALCLTLVIVVVYAKVQHYDFVGYDDELYVTQNSHVQKGITLEGIKWAFTTFHSANWHPVTWLSHMLDCQLYGLNPDGHHWTNIELHIANTLLLFFFLFEMTGALWQCAFVAALFALHPLHVESVAWISERKDVLSTFFGLLGIGAYYRYVKNSSIKYYLLAMILFSLGLMAKPMLVTIPFVLILLDFWPLKRFQWQHNFPLKLEKENDDAVRRNYRIILEKIPFLMIVVGSCIVTFIAQKSQGAIKAMLALPMKYRVENAVVSYVNYVFKTIWPFKLAVFYPHPGNTLPLWQVLGGAVLIAAVFYAAIKKAKDFPYIPVGLFWYLGTLVPVIGLVQVGDQAMADRYTYIPLIGIFIIVSWGVQDLLNQRLRGRRPKIGGLKSEVLSGASSFSKKRRSQNICMGITAAVILAALACKTFLQLNTWRNGITLFEHAVAVTKNNYLAQINLGAAYESIDVDKSIFHYKAALKIRPDYAMALFDLANAYSEKGDIDQAVRYYLKTLNSKPDYPAALDNLGVAFVKKGEYDKAIYYFRKALKNESKNANTRMNLANVFFLNGNPDEAISQYKKILQTDSKNADVHYNLACVLSSEKKYNEAIHQFNETLRINPKYSKADYSLGNIYLNQRNTTEAFLHYAKVIQIKPDDVQAYNKLGLILFNQGRFTQAGVFFSKAIQIDPAFSEARSNLDMVRKRMSE